MKKLSLVLFLLCVGFLLVSCAGERQGVVCDEIEYRLNTMAYSPDQRAYIEDELRTCREEEAQKKAGSAEARRSIYERYATQNPQDTTNMAAPEDISVSEALKDSSGVQIESIYDRYNNKNDEVPADTSAGDVSNFQ